MSCPCVLEGILANDMTTALVYEHEMAKNTDFRHGFESVIRNVAIGSDAGID